MGVLKRFRFRIGKMKRKQRNSSSGFLLMWGLHIGRELQLTYPLSQMFLVAPQNLPCVLRRVKKNTTTINPSKMKVKHFKS